MTKERAMQVSCDRAAIMILQKNLKIIGMLYIFTTITAVYYCYY